MIRAGGYDNRTGRLTAFLGLTEENVERMKAGEPIFVPLNEILGEEFEVDIVIYGGKGDVDDLRAVLAEHARMPGEE